MAFAPIQAKVPVEVGDVSVILTDYAGDEQDTARGEFQVLQADGTLLILVREDLVPHMPAEWISRARALVADVRAMGQTLISKEAQ